MLQAMSIWHRLIERLIYLLEMQPAEAINGQVARVVRVPGELAGFEDCGHSLGYRYGPDHC